MTATSTTVKPRFVGAKGAAGIPQWIISLMPPHGTYVEAFLGTGVIMRTKLRAARNIGIELDPVTIEKFWPLESRPDWLAVVHGDALTMLPGLQLKPHDLVYADPPYLGTARVDTNRKYYAHDQLDPEWHQKFLEVITALPCLCIVSGYESDLYAKRLKNWRSCYKWTVNRGGTRIREWVWCNFTEPPILHDARFVGGNYTDRQRVKRKIGRWLKRFQAMPADERWGMYEALTQVVAQQQPEFLHG